MNLHVDLCSYKAAEFAVTHWHYSKSMPASKTFKVGAWEDDRFIGVVIFSWGTQRFLGRMFGLEMTQCVELTRVALKSDHQAPVSRVLAIAIKFLKKHNPGIECIVSYADCDQNHHGGIYQACNFYYLGLVEQNGGTPRLKIRGKVMHGRTVGSKYGHQALDWIRSHVDPNAEKVFTKGKHKYAYPLSRRVREICEASKQEYPRRAASIGDDAAINQIAEGGSTPTAALH